MHFKGLDFVILIKNPGFEKNFDFRIHKHRVFGINFSSTLHQLYMNFSSTSHQHQLSSEFSFHIETRFAPQSSYPTL